ncbi:hypothetical protein Goklo_013518 [Gossypium klotzschianum]|uniref:Uncharacterized protein n=1 Tax=Gossypium klotzschianum TaxID=34286 RepID=A0A7J8U4S1_9ROSI|nr:hypothetical protein [Gossypium klotzschianum]
MSSSISLLVYLPYLEVLLFNIRCVFLISTRRHTFLSVWLPAVPAVSSLSIRHNLHEHMRACTHIRAEHGP